MKTRKILVSICLVMSILLLPTTSFAATQVSEISYGQQENETELVLDLTKVKPGDIIYQDEIYLLEDGSIAYSEEDAQKAEAKGIPIIDVLLRSYGIDCWEDNRVQMFCNFWCDEPIITKTYVGLYIQDVDMPIPDNLEEATLISYDAAGITRRATSPTHALDTTFNLSVPNIYSARIGLVDVNVTTTERYIEFVDRNRIETRR